MKRFLSLSLIVALLAISFQSCNKATNLQDLPQAKLEFAFSVTQLKNALKSASDSGYTQGITNVVVTIEDLQGNLIKNSEKIEIYNMNGSYISKPISLIAGGYKLTRFLVLDANNNIVYAAPTKGSAKAYLVANPLAISFTAQKDVTTKLTPEVLSTADSKPQDFGYATFSFELSKTFDFLVGAFIYNDAIKNYELTTASISIYNDTSLVYATQLQGKAPDSLIQSLNYDTLGITNKITLPERYPNYTVRISKLGYTTYIKTFTKEELSLYFRSEDKGPLMVVLEKSSDPLDGLIAYYPFDGDANDYGGLQNNGIEYSQGVYVNGVKGMAHDFNGTTDYIRLTNTLNLTNGLSFSFWVNSRGAYGLENNGTVISKYNMKSPGGQSFYITTWGWNTTPRNFIHISFYPYQSSSYRDWVHSDLTDADLQSWSKPQNWTIINPHSLILGNWTHVVVNCSASEISIWMNGEITCKKTREYTTYHNPLTEPTYIGNIPCGGEGSNNHFNGALDELRIYDRALSQTEITTLYNQ